MNKVRVTWLNVFNEVQEAELSCTYWSFDAYGVYLSWGSDNVIDFYILLSWEEASDFGFLTPFAPSAC